MRREKPENQLAGTSSPVTVTYYHRAPSALLSIERVFNTVAETLRHSVSIRHVFCRFRRGGFGILCNIAEAVVRQSAVNHITGDVHYLALGLRRKRTVLTIHDCGTLANLRGWRREIARLLWFEWPVNCVAAVTAVSEQTKAEILRFTSCPESRISVIPNPLPPGFSPAPAVFLEERPRLLQIGTRPNKNLENIARALQGLKCHLTILGSPSDSQLSLLDSCDVPYTVRSGLTSEQVIEAYRDTDIVLFCSTYEGFGLPIIEANAIGRAVVTSNIEPLSSVAGGSACLVDPDDIGSIREGILRVIRDSSYRAELVRLGLENAIRYDASVIAARYRNLYERIVAA